MGIKDIPIPAPEANQVRVKVMAAGICGSDLKFVADKMKVPLPIVLGHELVGIVDEVGRDVTKFKKGDWIVSMTTLSSCGECMYCKQGLIMFCPERKGIGIHVNGAMAEYVIVNPANAFKVPDGIEDKISMAACEAFTCSLRGAGENALIKPGDLVVVSGPGSLGIGAIQVAKLRGAYVIAYGLPKDKHRLELAKKLGADDISIDEEDLRRKILERNPHGADVAFESAGVEASMNLCIDLVRKQGTLAQLGVYGKKITVDFNAILDKELHVTNNFGGHRSTWETALKLIKDKKIDIASLASTRLPLEKWQEGFELAATGGALKVLLLP
jgi:L-iditol 2-dehydrogenase